MTSTVPSRTDCPCGFGANVVLQIPYGATQPEIIAFLGRNSKMLNDKQEPVHIIMDRVSSKTNDAYVEFLTLDDAVNTVDRHNGNNAKGRVARLGDRPIEVELSSQSQLMADLFPVATGVTWHGSRPEIQPMNPREPWTNFKTFVTDEEMTMLIKHVEVPNRVSLPLGCCLLETGSNGSPHSVSLFARLP